MTLGKIVCALREYAEDANKEVKYGMGARAMASGRSPSMERIKTRRAGGAGVGVSDGSGVRVAVEVAVGGGVYVGVNVAGRGMICC